MDFESGEVLSTFPPVPGYVISDLLGSGKHGEVRKAIHNDSGRAVALKAISKSAVAKDKTWSEIKAMQKLRHPNVVRLFDVIETPTHTVLVLEFLTGGELFDYLVSRTRLSEREAQKFIRQTLKALSYCHHAGIVHRDLKLENLLLDEDSSIKIADFGFSNMYFEDQLMSTFAGTVAYAPPEIILNERYPGPPADIWCLGVIIYTILVGKMPFQDDNEAILFQKIINAEYELPDHLSDEAKSLITGILKKNPEERLTLQQIWNHPWMRLYDSERDELDSVVQPVPEDIKTKVFERMSELSYNRSVVEKLIEHDLVCKETATYHLLVEKYISEKKEAEKNAEIQKTTASLMKLLQQSGGTLARPKEKFIMKPPKSRADEVAAVPSEDEFRGRIGSAAGRLQAETGEASATSIDSGIHDRRSTMATMSRPARKTALLTRHRQTQISVEINEAVVASDDLDQSTNDEAILSPPCEAHGSTVTSPSNRESFQSDVYTPGTRLSIVSVTSPGDTINNTSFDASFHREVVPDMSPTASKYQEAAYLRRKSSGKERAFTWAHTPPSVESLQQKTGVSAEPSPALQRYSSQDESSDLSQYDSDESAKEKLRKMRAGVRSANKKRAESMEAQSPKLRSRQSLLQQLTLHRANSNIGNNVPIPEDSEFPHGLMSTPLPESEDKSPDIAAQKLAGLSDPTSINQFGAATTSMLPPLAILDEMRRALAKEGIQFTQLGPGKLLCQFEATPRASFKRERSNEARVSFMDDSLILFEMEVCLLSQLGMHGIKFRRLGGDMWRYKERVAILVQSMKL